ncbi:MAG: VWA domain-containing protein [Acidobacteriales bacterium]|nr:VWA domain-containing protein [Terriglobales bacterium]
MLGKISLALAAAVAMYAQAAQVPSLPEPIRVNISEVIVPVTVTDIKGRFVSNLELKDFKLFDEGKPQTIRYFSHEQNQPVVVGFLVDMSNANRLHWKTYQEAAIDLVTQLLPGDKRYNGYLVSYSNEAELQMDTTWDSEKIIDKIRGMKPGGGAALYDAIYLACTRRLQVKGEPLEPRRVLVIIGDGHDNASKKSIEEVLEVAQRKMVTIFGISTKAFGFAAEGEANLARVTGETGGRVMYPLEGVYKDVSGYLSTPSDEGNYALKVGTGGYAAAIASGMFRAIADVAGEVTTQYVLRYIPTDTDVPKTFRNIRVEVSVPGVQVRARRGYFPDIP